MKTPMLLLACSFALGILAVRGEPAIGRSVGVALAASGVSLLVGLLALRWERWVVASLLVLAGFGLGGAGAARLFEFRFPPDHVSRVAALGADLDDPMRLEGMLVSTPLRTSTGLQFDVAVRRLDSRRQACLVTGKVRLHVAASDDPESMAALDSLRLAYGDSIRTLALLRRPRVYQNPGSFDFRRWMESIEDLYWIGSVKTPLLVEKLPRSRRPWLAELFMRARVRLLQTIDGLYPPWSAEGRYGAVLKAVLLGDRPALDADTIENFRRSGLYHQLVVSGLQVGLLALLAGLFLRLFPLSEDWRSVLVLGFLWIYTALLEQRAPTLRAVLMIFAYLLARYFYREQAALNAIGLGALVLLVLRPAWLFESGFQLTFAAVLLVAGLAVPIVERSTEPYRRALSQLDNPDRDLTLAPRQAQFRLDLRSIVAGLKTRVRRLERHPRFASSLVTGTVQCTLLAAEAVLFAAVMQFGLMMPMAGMFHRVTLAAVGLNAVATPLMTVLLALALPTILLAVVAPSLATAPAAVLGMVTRAFLGLTNFPNLPTWLSFRVPEPPLWVSLGFAVSIVAAAVALGRQRRVFGAALAALSFLGCLITLHPFTPRFHRGVLEVTAIDCGNGDALFVAFPDGTTMLVDAGGTPSRGLRDGVRQARRWDPGEDVVSPFLWSRGLKEITIVVLSHAHQDHIGGLGAVVRNFHVGEFWQGTNPSAPDYQAFLAVLGRRGVPVRSVGAGDAIERGAARVRVLWPPARTAQPTSVSNDDSVVLQISYQGASVLLAGGISRRVEEALLEGKVPLESRALKVAHHGSGSSTSAEFLARVRPQVAMVSAQAASGRNLPNPETLERLRVIGAQVFRTDLDGAVAVEMDGSTLRVHAYGEPRREWAAGTAGAVLRPPASLSPR